MKFKQETKVKVPKSFVKESNNSLASKGKVNNMLTMKPSQLPKPRLGRGK